MRVAVFGTGGVGGYYGGRLAQAGEEVIFIARGEHLKACRRTVCGRFDQGDFLVKPVQAVSDPRQVGTVEMVLLAVKAWQVPECAQAMLPMIGEETGVIFLGNGVDAISQLSAVLGEQHVLGGRCNISTFIAGAGHIQHVGIDPRVAFGELDGRLSQRAERLRQAFAKANVTADIRKISTLPSGRSSSSSRRSAGWGRSRGRRWESSARCPRHARCWSRRSTRRCGSRGLKRSTCPRISRQHDGIHRQNRPRRGGITGARRGGRLPIGAGRTKRHGEAHGAGAGDTHPGTRVYLR